MSKPVLDRSQHADDAFYAFMGRVRLRLVEHNVDAITATMFLRELVEAGGSTLRVEQGDGHRSKRRRMCHPATAVKAYAHGSRIEDPVMHEIRNGVTRTAMDDEPPEA